MLTLSSAMTAALARATMSLGIAARVYGPSLGEWRTFAAGKADGWGDDVSYTINSISKISRALDLYTGLSKVSTVTISLAWDEYVKDMILNHPLKHTRIGFALTAEGVIPNDSVAMFSGTVYDVDIKYGESVDIITKSSITRWFDRPIRLYSINEHPITVGETIMENMLSASSVNNTSFNPDLQVDISHWVCDVGNSDSYSGERAYVEETPTRAIMAEHVKCMEGAIVVQEDGRATYVRVDRSAAFDKLWTEDDLVGVARIVQLYGNIRNRVVAQSHRAPDTPVNPKAVEPLIVEHVEEDTDSIGDFELNGDGFQEQLSSTEPYQLKHIYNPSILLDEFASASVPGVGDTFDVFAIWSNCGSRWPGYPAGTQPPGAILTAARTAYLLIDQEIVECDNLDVYGVANIRHPYFNSITTVPASGTYRVKTRGALGTTATAHAIQYGAQDVLDITVLVAVARNRLELFKRGLTIIERRTSLQHIDVQIGDVIGMTDPHFVKHNIDGITTALKWIVVEKVPVPFEGYIDWKLALINDGTTANRPNIQPSIFSRGGIFEGLRQQLKDNIGTANYVIDGMDLGTPSGFDVDLNAGIFGNQLVRWQTDTETLTASASKDTYYYADIMNGGIIELETALGAGAPSAASTMIPLWKVITDGSGITDTEDLRVRTTIGGKLVDSNTLGVRNQQLSAEAAGIVPNGEFGDLTPPRDITISPPDNWQTGYVTSAPGGGYIPAGDTYWGSGNAIYFDASTHQTGGRSIKIDTSALSAETLYGITSEELVPIPGDTLLAMVANLQASSGADTVWFTVEFFAADKTTSVGTASVQGALPVVGSWYRAVKIYKTLSTARYARFHVMLFNTSTGVLYVDYVKVFRAFPAYRAYCNAGITSAAPATPTVVPYDAETYDYGNNFDSALAYDYTAPHYGIHNFSASAVIQDVATTKWARADLYVNGALYKKGPVIVNGTGGALDLDLAIDASDVELQAGDTVDVRVTHNDTVSRFIGRITGVDDSIFMGSQRQGGFG